MTGQEKVNVMSIYEIRVRVHLDPQWSAWFEGLAIIHDKDGTTLLRGNLVDEAALHGVLMQVRDLAVPLLSLNRASAPTEEQELQDAQEKPVLASSEATPSCLPQECVSPDERDS
jgi:hypothetical protein